MIDIATRVHNHNYRLDPIVRSLLDTDFYKLLMLNFILRHHASVPVTFTVLNRTRTVRLAEIVPEAALREQLDHARSLSFSRSELVWLAGNTFYGQRNIFPPEFIAWLSSYRLPPYDLAAEDGQWVIRVQGPWAEVTLWEIYALSILNELKSRWAMRALSKFELDILYSRAKTRLWDKIERLRPEPSLSIADFGTRRRHGFLWQEWVVQAMAGELGARFVGTSNAFLAFKHDLEAIGTNAHELPMVLACLAGDDEAAVRGAQYRMLDEWRHTYQGALLVMLPDTFGTTQFLANAPDWAADWTGIRVDSKDPTLAGDEAIAWWQARGRDPQTKRILFSDGLDVDDILHLHRHFRGRVRDGYGWGTLLTNDFRDCHPRGADGLAPVSLVCKVTEAAGRPAVKLSDNWNKATGPASEVARYRALFGTAGVAGAPVVV